MISLKISTRRTLSGFFLFLIAAVIGVMYIHAEIQEIQPVTESTKESPAPEFSIRVIRLPHGSPMRLSDESIRKWIKDHKDMGELPLWLTSGFMSEDQSSQICSFALDNGSGQMVISKTAQLDFETQKHFKSPDGNVSISAKPYRKNKGYNFRMKMRVSSPDSFEPIIFDIPSHDNLVLADGQIQVLTLWNSRQGVRGDFYMILAGGAKDGFVSDVPKSLPLTPVP